MECTEFRELMEADPATTDPRADEHAHSCAACQAYAARLRASERLINAALRFDVAALQANVQQQRNPAPRWRFTAIAGTAAALVAAVVIWSLVRPVPNGGVLAADVAQHWHHEPQSWVVTNAQISPNDIHGALKNAAQIDLAAVGPVTYATSCFFRGHWVPHLVVQGQAGPIMVLLLPDEPVAGPQPVTLAEQGLVGVIVPHGRGSVALLANAAEPLEQVQQNLVEAVEWSI